MEFESLKSHKITSPQAQKVYIKNVVTKKREKKAKSDAFKIKNSLHWGWEIYKPFFFIPDKYHMKD